MKSNNAKETPKIRCKDVGCRISGFWAENRSDGEIVLKTINFHGGEKHVSEINLGEFALKRIKQDPRFAFYMKKLLEG